MTSTQGPKVPWVLVFFDFVGCYPDLPEWVDGKKLQHFLSQFTTRFRRFCHGKFTSYHHCMNLRDLHFGRLSSWVVLLGCSNLSLFTKSLSLVFILLLKLAIRVGLPLPLVEVLVCPVGPLIFFSLSSDHFLLSLINCAFCFHYLAEFRARHSEYQAATKKSLNSLFLMVQPAISELASSGPGSTGAATRIGQTLGVCGVRIQQRKGGGSTERWGEPLNIGEF